LDVIWNTPSSNCRYLLMCVHSSHRPYGYPPFTMCSWQRVHKNPWCNSWHLCCHCARCWLPHGTKIITCVSFNCIQLFLLMSWHCAHQRWHSHFSWRCHCWPDVSGFTPLVLCNSRIYCFRYDSSQRKELLLLTPH
jgi:hypothetical protein